jgi:hypothetical protein
VGFLLQAAIGGLARDFNDIVLSDWMFLFSVSCKQVGIFIYQLRLFRCMDSIVYFHIWNEGGRNGSEEFRDFISEENDSWVSVSNKKMSYVDATIRNTVIGCAVLEAVHLEPLLDHISAAVQDLNHC